MKTIQELKSARLVDLAENAKEWKIKATPALNNWFKFVIYRNYLGSFPEYIRTCYVFQWWLAKAAAWAKGQKPCKIWAMASAIISGVSFAAIVMMTRAGVCLADQMWAIAIWAISLFILTLSICKLW